MAHRDKLRSFNGTLTVVGFFKDGILVKKEYYDHRENGEWERRINEEAEWNKEKGQTTRFL